MKPQILAEFSVYISYSQISAFDGNNEPPRQPKALTVPIWKKVSP